MAWNQRNDQPADLRNLSMAELLLDREANDHNIWWSSPRASRVGDIPTIPDNTVAEYHMYHMYRTLKHGNSRQSTSSTRRQRYARGLALEQPTAEAENPLQPVLHVMLGSHPAETDHQSEFCYIPNTLYASPDTTPWTEYDHRTDTLDTLDKGGSYKIDNLTYWSTDDGVIPTTRIPSTFAGLHHEAAPAETQAKAQPTNEISHRLSDLFRHIKCDETPDACKNCTSTGRVCDGYDQYRLPATGKPVLQGFPDYFPITVGTRTAMTSDERRCFSYFQVAMVPTLVGPFTSSLWRKLVLQMCDAEPAVHHAVIGISAIQQGIEARKLRSFATAAKCDWNRFALEQLGRSFSLLRIRSASNDPQLPSITLVCCLLFVSFEMLQGQYETAFTHLRSGLEIIKRLQAHRMLVPYYCRDSSPVEQILVASFAHMDNQVAYFQRQEPTLQLDEALEQYLPPADNRIAMYSIGDIRRTFEPLLNACTRFLIQSAKAKDPMHMEMMLQKKHLLLSQLHRFSRMFELFRSQSYRHLNPEEQLGADIILLRQRTLLVNLDICIRPWNDRPADHYASDFEDIVTLAEAIICRTSVRPSLSIDIGIVIPLCLVILVCQDPALRWRAIDALRSWPHQEGPWDSSLCAQIAIETSKITTYIASRPKRTPTKKRTLKVPPLRTDSIMISPDRRLGYIPYTVGVRQEIWWFSLDDADQNSSTGGVGSREVANWTPFMASRFVFVEPEDLP
ncbi:hypothetical protein BO71DRAFT_431465 [Aspergillus ellipticus CBS 707.79]|uniref:Zn(2)-C6 fungal-type domain-containing protein n=1 Tax=Aspergillus ellipticus CBS 707.79 TaxID=1448320 RepID=A0A319DNR8_9EURO|nr:hypothetical protein BO71DRAFT_431465 [Aspergillus ellipticus CBS 707.79]